MLLKFSTAAAVVVFSCLAADNTAHAVAVYSAAGDFSATNNPNGVWSYGWSTTTGSAFNLDAVKATVSALNVWEGIPASDSFGNPSITFNSTSNPISISGTIWTPSRLAFHPGSTGQNAIVRWTAPTAGLFAIDAVFQGRSQAAGATTDVHVLHDSASLFNGAVLGFGSGSGPSFQGTVVVLAGDTIDFTVGFGGNGTYLFDTTQLDATISAVPEPAKLTILASGAVALLLNVWIRRKRFLETSAQSRVA